MTPHSHLLPPAGMVIVALLLAPCLSQAQTIPPSADHTYALRLDQARIGHLKGVAGNTSAAEESFRSLQELAREKPEDPVVIAYLGSATLLKAARTWAVWRKGEMAREGGHLLDRAVDMAPDHLEVRFMRASSLRWLPAIFGQRAKARADFTWLLPRVARGVEQGELDPRLGAAALYFEADFLDDEGHHDQARLLWQMVIDMAPDSEPAASARRRLGRHQTPGTTADRQPR